MLTPAATLSVLLFLPESIQPSTYVPITSKDSLKQAEVDTLSVADLSEKVVQIRVDRLLSTVPTLSCVVPEDDGVGHQELVSEWLQIRARNIDTETGMLSFRINSCTVCWKAQEGGCILQWDCEGSE